MKSRTILHTFTTLLLFGMRTGSKSKAKKEIKRSKRFIAATT